MENEYIYRSIAMKIYWENIRMNPGSIKTSGIYLFSECARAGIRSISDIFRISEGRQLYDDYWLKLVPQVE